ncbi:cyclin N-terminal domain-containing protein 1 [Lampris incognitus]|uniref:cyclin N-terminal domain-containing protein 1 n=1 Tax=Lampris incognitus TaxID=2546036 RepID=UPI0024B4A1DB|nr:cyclin N-terminal domain-containing protein 1 [Lampris incognitus]
MARRFLSAPNPCTSVKFGEASFELLSDFLININDENKDNLCGLTKCSGQFKDKKVMECIFLITEKLRLDPLVGYNAIEILERFMVKHLQDLFTTPTLQDAAAGRPSCYEDLVFDKLKEKFPLIVFSSVQLASKLSLHRYAIDNNTAVQFLHSMGLSVSKQILMESELMILKGLEFRLNTLNPLTYVETLLEVLGHNESSVPVDQLQPLYYHILQFIFLQKTDIYESLLMATTQCLNPSQQQREKFLTVKEDYMLLAVGVIAIAIYIFDVSKWEQVVEELNHITGVSCRSIRDFTHVTLLHITRTLPQ